MRQEMSDEFRWGTFVKRPLLKAKNVASF